MSDEQRQTADKSKQLLYLLLVLAASIPLFFTLTIPGKPEDQSVDLYAQLMDLPTDKPVLIESDWTTSTRGENGAHFESAMRILMRRGIKFVLYSASDAQGPLVARNFIRKINEEHVKEGGKAYKPWEDYLVLGFYPNLEGFAVSLGSDFRKALSGKQTLDTNNNLRNVFESPVLTNVRKINDFSVMLVITGTSSMDVLVERLFGKVPMCAMVTGVMGPQTAVYYRAGQLTGLASGLKGIYDIETMMEYGVNKPDAEGKIPIHWDKYPDKVIENFPGKTNRARASKYFPALHSALTLMIAAIITGNVLMLRARKANGGAK